MNDQDAFIQAIREDPKNDDLRLVYSDWLEENNQPFEAEYLRTELKLAKLFLDSSDAPALREQLWQAWSTVDPNWLMTFTQPRMLRANPTPFPSAWTHFDLGDLRPGRGTYDFWSYESLPPLILSEADSQFQYLKKENSSNRSNLDTTTFREIFHLMQLDAAEKNVRLPESFVSFMIDPILQNRLDSVTGCYFSHPDKEYLPIRTSLGEGFHFHFYCDSQSCILWDLYLHPSGNHCVIARMLDFFDFLHEKIPENLDPNYENYTGPQAWFVAPSFETFIYRIWLENQIWYIEHEDFVRSSSGQKVPPITPAIQAYIDHYRTQKNTGLKS